MGCQRHSNTWERLVCGSVGRVAVSILGSLGAAASLLRFAPSPQETFQNGAACNDPSHCWDWKTCHAEKDRSKSQQPSFAPVPAGQANSFFEAMMRIM